MNLKKTVLSSLAVVALSISMAAPVAFAEDPITNDVTSNATVNEGGDLVVNSWASSISFNPATVTTTESQTVTQTGANHRVLQINDSHAYSNGYTVQMTASDLVIEDSPYFIDANNVSVRKAGGSPHSSCLTGNWTVNGGNDFQKVNFVLGNTTSPSAHSDYAPLSGPVTLVSATAGRGCGGPYQTNYGWQLNVPKGTYTANNSAVYSGSITISTVMEPGN